MATVAAVYDHRRSRNLLYCRRSKTSMTAATAESPTSCSFCAKPRGGEFCFELLYTLFAFCVSPNALCSITFSISCSQSRASYVTLQYGSAVGEGHARIAGRVSCRWSSRFVQSAANRHLQSKDSAGSVAAANTRSTSLDRLCCSRTRFAK